MTIRSAFSSTASAALSGRDREASHDRFASPRAIANQQADVVPLLGQMRRGEMIEESGDVMNGLRHRTNINDVGCVASRQIKPRPTNLWSVPVAAL